MSGRKRCVNQFWKYKRAREIVLKDDTVTLAALRERLGLTIPAIKEALSGYFDRRKINGWEPITLPPLDEKPFDDHWQTGNKKLTRKTEDLTGVAYRYGVRRPKRRLSASG